jgi:hypothetical protein
MKFSTIAAAALALSLGATQVMAQTTPPATGTTGATGGGGGGGTAAGLGGLGAAGTGAVILGGLLIVGALASGGDSGSHGGGSGSH